MMMMCVCVRYVYCNVGIVCVDVVNGVCCV